MAAWLAVMWIVSVCTPSNVFSSLVPDAYQRAVLSRDAQYALVYVGRSKSEFWNQFVSDDPEEFYRPTRAYLVRLRDQRILRLPKEALKNAYWANDDTLSYTSGSTLHTLRMHPDGTLNDESRTIRQIRSAGLMAK
jgi:hypothetical protein